METICLVIFYIIAGFLSLVGICSVIRSITLSMLSVKERGDCATIIHANDENAEMAIRYAIELNKISGNTAAPILVVDCSMSKKVKTICRAFSMRYPNVMLCDPQEIAGIVINNYKK